MKPIISENRPKRNPLKSQPVAVTADLVPAPALMVRPSLNFGRVSLPKIFRFWFPVIVYSGIIYCGSSIPLKKAPEAIPYLDKLLHILEYIPFGFLTGRAFFLTRGRDWPIKGLIRSVILLSLMYGLSDEFHQAFVPGRESGLDDALADTLGGVLGAWVFVFLYTRNQKLETKDQK